MDNIKFSDITVGSIIFNRDEGIEMIVISHEGDRILVRPRFVTVDGNEDFALFFDDVAYGSCTIITVARKVQYR